MDVLLFFTRVEKKSPYRVSYHSRAEWCTIFSDRLILQFKTLCECSKDGQITIDNPPHLDFVVFPTMQHVHSVSFGFLIIDIFLSQSKSLKYVVECVHAPAFEQKDARLMTVEQEFAQTSARLAQVEAE